MTLESFTAFRSAHEGDEHCNGGASPAPLPMIVREWSLIVRVYLTQVEIVNCCGCRYWSSSTRNPLLVPDEAKSSAFPYLPGVTVAATVLPLLPLPEMSGVVLPASIWSSGRRALTVTGGLPGGGSTGGGAPCAAPLSHATSEAE